MLRTQPDARLTRLVAGGYEGPFEELMRRYRGPLQAYGRRFVQAAAAEDIVQQAFLDLWARLAAGVQIRDVRPWLYRVVHNAALNTIRRGDYRSAQLPEIVHSESPDVAFERNAAVREALAGVAALPGPQREALVMGAVNGHSRAQIAAFMGVSDGAVGQMLHRARVSVRAAMSVVLPWPLFSWVAGVRRGRSSGGARLLGLTGAGGAPASLLVKTGATVAVIAAAAAAPLVVKHVGPQPGSAGGATVIAGADPPSGGALDLRAARLADGLSPVSPHPRAHGPGRPGRSASRPRSAAPGTSEAAPQPQPTKPPAERSEVAEAAAAPAEPSPEAPTEASPPSVEAPAPEASEPLGPAAIEAPPAEP
jgi:RNA polymerase sigma factor (sigma-70 family)